MRLEHAAVVAKTILSTRAALPASDNSPAVELMKEAVELSGEL